VLRAATTMPPVTARRKEEMNVMEDPCMVQREG